MDKKINQEGIVLIKHFESLRLEAYQDSVGIWTIGWGHTGNRDGSVYKGLIITEEEAENFLLEDLKVFESGVNSLVTLDINDNQFSALVSFAFNLGVNSLKKSTLLKLLNENNQFNCAKEFVKWSKAGGIRLEGLVRRRLSERNLFCSYPNFIVEKLTKDWENNYLEM
ncbi:lysozyme [Halarcobacter ebronensis]|uniref:Lysozyme n=1 Tax=Halarcobacter ebronensis TaxID=1462615 RepID=A0A4V1M0R0_9BACT|nr:lysozyme [Halarcobacter ebronensis]QKF82422.1 muraminidase [Halarcobacter ebronensis]RXK07555.1 muraminidase [Halarcobacter ebronensis]